MSDPSGIIECMYDDETAARFWGKVAKAGPTECWLWLDYLDRYGQFFIRRGVRRAAHRMAYELAVGPIPAGLVIDHLCGNPPCVNPHHLEPVTQRENLMRADSVPRRHLAKTHCPQGHEYAGENLRLRKSGARQCKECCRARDRRRHAARRAAA